MKCHKQLKKLIISLSRVLSLYVDEISGAKFNRRSKRSKKRLMRRWSIWLKCLNQKQGINLDLGKDYFIGND